ncbi:helix-hairpin-helix domain-containing protein [Nitrosomonas sp.]|uniref:helix-hairpin-helix domain-containing protein n=1 Tax=Nitrosomonas sp. TaxID=42353 RepID=UPI001D8FE45B|nr:helix-hairpin-helix domain-containing protein [Nitrosomonas sp.]MBX3616179.1 helix-hairpin-helix domain-containing protein [Nitrosomonas sp.]
MEKLTDVAGIGPVTAKLLLDHQIKTVAALAAVKLIELQKIPGFGGETRARAVKQAAADYLKEQRPKPLAARSDQTQTPAVKTTRKENAASKTIAAIEPEQPKAKKKKKKKKDGKENTKDKSKKGKDKKKGKNKKKS